MTINQTVTNLKNTRENPTTARKFCGEATHNVKRWYKYFTILRHLFSIFAPLCSGLL